MSTWAAVWIVVAMTVVGGAVVLALVGIMVVHQ
jgi:hypothetical protein